MSGERDHARVLFEHGMDLSNRLDRLHRERQAELERGRTELEYARWPWLRRLDSGGDGPEAPRLRIIPAAG